MISTTNRIDMLYSVHKLSPRESLSISIRVADDSVHHLQSVGYLHVPLHVGTNRFGSVFVQMFYTPLIPATILLLSRIARQHNCSGFQSVTMLDNGRSYVQLFHCQHCAQDMHVEMTNINGLLYTHPLFVPTAEECTVK